MRKIWGYELRRLLFNKYTAVFVAVIGFYSHWVMQGEIIIGVANTAPFSPWSFGVYMARVMPLLLVALLFFLSFLYSGDAQAVRVLTDASSMKPERYRLIRYGAVAVAFFFILLIPIIYAVCFYGITFQFTRFYTLIAPLAMVVFPSFFLTIGLGVLGARFHPAIIFALMPVVLVVSILPLPDWMDLYGTAFLMFYPVAMDTLDPPFYISSLQIVYKSIYMIVGIAFLISAIATKENRSQ